jgi:hypothetical protein
LFTRVLWRPAILLGDLDAHQPELEAGVDHVPGDLLRLVHLVDEGADLLLGEVADHLAEAGFVLRKIGQGKAAGVVAHAVTSASS